MFCASSVRCARRAQRRFIRPFATEHTPTSSSSSDLPPPPNPPSRQRTRLNPSPRYSVSQKPQPLLSLPPDFGRNQLLSVSNSTRALLEDIVTQFRAPIRYAFAYGSGVFEQDGYASMKQKGVSPMLDFMFAVSHPDHWHSINMSQYAAHYPLHARALGSSFVSKVQQICPGVWFNTYVCVNGITIKYGVTSVDDLCSDLLAWDSLYLAGRMHKPLRIIRDDARVRLTQQVNLTSALRAALLTLPEEFTEKELFETISSISYMGDPRMFLPAENRSKVQNIVRKQSPQFKELYYRLALGLPGVHWSSLSSRIQQDVNPHARAAHIKKLPANLRTRLISRYSKQPGIPPKEADEVAFWVNIAGDKDLHNAVRLEISRIVRNSATIQTAKGLVSAGIGKSIRYSAEKIGKWWRS